MRRLIALSYLPVKYKATANIQLGKIGTEKKIGLLHSWQILLKSAFKDLLFRCLIRLLYPYKKTEKTVQAQFYKGCNFSKCYFFLVGIARPEPR